MDQALPEYELYAIRYARREARRADHFIGGDPHDGPMPMDYFVWYTTGRYMRHPFLARSFEVEDVVGLVRLNFARRVTFYDGPAELFPGITLHPVGGHTPGMQFVRVHTRRGWVVLASDVTHYYENMESGRPFTAAFHIGDMLEAFAALRAAAPSPAHIVPGHDPLVLRRAPTSKASPSASM